MRYFTYIHAGYRSIREAHDSSMRRCLALPHRSKAVVKAFVQAVVVRRAKLGEAKVDILPFHFGLSIDWRYDR